MPDITIVRGNKRCSVFSESEKGYAWMVARFTHVTINDGVIPKVAGASFNMEYLNDIINDFEEDGLEVSIK